MDGAKALCAMRISALREKNKQSNVKSESSKSQGAGAVDSSTVENEALDQCIKPVDVAAISNVLSLQASELRAPPEGQSELAKLNVVQSSQQKTT